MKVLRGKELTSKSWSGGLTTELFIYPEKSNYKNLDFNFRLSTATVEVENSVFTPLPAVKRELMLLTGKLKLVHTNKYNKILSPFESDRFLGDWQTESFGIVTDFNLMLRGETEGYLDSIHSKNISDFEIDSDCDLIGFYCFQGTASTYNNTIHESDFLIGKPTEKTLDIQLEKDSRIILVRIWLNS